MKRFAIALVVALAAAGARADEKPRADEPNLKAGNFRFGASLSLEHDSFSNATTQTLFSGQVPTTIFAAGALGAQWFITPSVAFGPGIRYGHRFGSGVIADSDQYL